MKGEPLEGFVPDRDRGDFDESEFAQTLAYFGSPALPDQYLEFLRSHYGTRTRLSIGYEARGGPRVLGPRAMRFVSAGHTWGREFMPFMSNTYAFIAFDLRSRGAAVDPPIVFLDWGDEDDDRINYEKVQPLADDIDGLLGLLGLWRSPADLPEFVRCYEATPYEELGLVPDPLVFPAFAEAGDMLRSGLMGEQRLRVGRLMDCVAECSEQPELVEELTVRRVWERLRGVFGERVIPFMTGEDGWLALDYRLVDSSPPVVFIARNGDEAAGEPRHVAHSVVEAFDMFT